MRERLGGLVVPYLSVDVPALQPDVAARKVFYQVVEVLLRELVVGIGVLHQREGLVHVPLPVERHAHDVLRKHVKRVLRHPECVEVLLYRGVEHDRALDQVVAVQHYGLALCGRLVGVAGPPDPLYRPGHALGRAELDDVLYRPDVDAQLQAGRRDRALERSLLQQLLHVQPRLPRQRAVVGRYVLAVAVPLLQVEDDPLGPAPGVREYERRLAGLYYPVDLLVGRRLYLLLLARISCP